MKFKDSDYLEYDNVYSKPKKVVKSNQLVITDEMITKLVSTKVNHKDILGYVRLNSKNEEEYCKYDKTTELYVVYDKENNIIEKRLKLWREYSGDKAFEYYNEIDE